LSDGDMEQQRVELECYCTLKQTSVSLPIYISGMDYVIPESL